MISCLGVVSVMLQSDMASVFVQSAVVDAFPLMKEPVLGKGWELYVISDLGETVLDFGEGSMISDGIETEIVIISVYRVHFIPLQKWT